MQNKENQWQNQMSGNTNLALKAGVLYLIAELLTRSVSFLVTPVFTRILPTDVFADAKIFESWVYLLAPILSVCIYQSISRAKYDFGHNYKGYLSSIIFLMTVVTVIVGIIGFFFRDVLASFFGFVPSMLLLMLLYCLAYNSIQCVQMYERQLLHYKNNILLTVLAVIPGVAISIFFVLKYGSQLSDSDLLVLRLSSFFIPTTIIGFILIFIVFLRGKTLVNWKQWQYGIKFSIPLMICTLSTQVFYQSDKIMVREFCGLKAAAIVALATTVGYIIDILVHAIDNAWRPWLFDQLEEKNYDKIKDFWKLLIFFVGCLILAMVLIAPELVLFLGGLDYMASVWIMPPIICGAFANFLMIGYTAVEQFYKKTRFSGYAGFIAAGLNLVFNYIGIKLFGYMACAYATALSYLIATLIHYYLVRNFEKENVLSFRKSLIMFFVIFSVGMICMLTYSWSFIIRWGILLAVTAILMVYFRKHMIVVYHMFKGEHESK